MTSPAVELLPLVVEANRRLGLSDEVPLDVPAVIEKVYEAVAAPAREDAFADPYLLEGLTHGLVRCYRAQSLPDLDEQAAELRIGLEQIRQALAYLVEEAQPVDTRPPAGVARWLIDVLEAPQTEVAALLGVAARTLHRWTTGESAPSGLDAARLRTTARLAAILRHALTGPGILLWLTTDHPDLGGPPAALLDDPADYPLLVRLAARLRSHSAT